ncbi:MAG: hypothetical protein V7L31_32460 [Nostoc sp.]
MSKSVWANLVKFEHHASTLTTLAKRNNCIAHLLQQRWRCFARLQAIASYKQRRKMLLKTS